MNETNALNDLKSKYESPSVTALGPLTTIVELTGAATNTDGEVFNS